MISKLVFRFLLLQILMLYTCYGIYVFKSFRWLSSCYSFYRKVCFDKLFWFCLIPSVESVNIPLELIVREDLWSI